MEPFELLSDLDKDKIVNYIEHFCSNESLPDHRQAPLEKILQYWNASKAELLPMFNNQLIITAPVEYSMGQDELCELMRQEVLKQPVGKNLYNALRYDIDVDTGTRLLIEYLFADYILVANRFDPYSRTNYSFPLANGHTYKVNAGTKPLKIIKKLCDSYKISGFEEFQIAHSVVLNQKKLRGELCLSIHPLDYMTMSDNGYDWDTCMRWRTNGEYRQGTVEMMNSPYIVVGYLKGDGLWDFVNDTYPHDKTSDNINKWNNKKWRCLFVVDNNAIISIKNYPYQNNFLTQEAIKQIAKAAGWGEVSTYPFYRSKQMVIDTREIFIDIEPGGAMYDDFEQTDHFIAVNPNDDYDIVNHIEYSGYSECMWCGNIDYDVIGQEGEEDCLVCHSCAPVLYCHNCGERIYSSQDYTKMSDGTVACSYCFDNYTFYCPVLKDAFWSEDQTTLYIKEAHWYVSVVDECWEAYPELWKKFYIGGEPEIEALPYGGTRCFLKTEFLTDYGLQQFGLKNPN